LILLQILRTVTDLLISAIGIYRLLLIVYFLMSWLPGAYESKLGQILVRICEPYVSIFRQFIPPIGMISLAGLAAYITLYLVESGIIAVYEILVQLLVSIL